MLKILDIERTQAKKGFNRWLLRYRFIYVSVLSILGIFYPTKVLGITRLVIIWIFSVSIAFVGVMLLLSSKWIERAGPRKVAVYSAILWSLGFIVSYIGIKYHQFGFYTLGMDL